VNTSYPTHVAELLNTRVSKDIAKADKCVVFPRVPSRKNDIYVCFRELLDGLRRVGFKLTDEDAGLHKVAFSTGRAGGYYFGKFFRTL